MRQVIPINAASSAGSIEEMQRRMDLGDRTPELLAALAQAHLERGSFDAAVAASVEWLEQNEVNPDALMLLGHALLHTSRWSEAGEAFEAILAIDPAHAGALAGKASAEGQVPPAAPTAAQNPSTGAHVEEGLAASAIATSDWRAAVRYCSHLVQLQPDHFEAWVNLGVARYHLDELEESEFAFRQAVKLQPDSPLPYLNLAILAGHRGEFDAAVDGYRCAIQLGDSSVTALWNLAVAEAGSGRTEEADSLLSQLIASHPEAAPDAWMMRARLAAEKGTGIDAERALNQVINLRPERWEAWLNLGILRYRRGAITDALACFERACEINPGAAEAIRAQAAAALENGDMKRVSTLRRRLNELGSAAPELTYHLGLWLETQSRWDDAIRAYSEALKENPAFTEALTRLGHLLARRGRPQEAADCWRRVLALRPEFAESYFDSAAG